MVETKRVRKSRSKNPLKQKSTKIRKNRVEYDPFRVSGKHENLHLDGCKNLMNAILIQAMSDAVKCKSGKPDEFYSPMMGDRIRRKKKRTKYYKQPDDLETALEVIYSHHWGRYLDLFDINQSVARKGIRSVLNGTKQRKQDFIFECKESLVNPIKCLDNNSGVVYNQDNERGW